MFSRSRKFQTVMQALKQRTAVHAQTDANMGCVKLAELRCCRAAMSETWRQKSASARYFGPRPWR